MTLNFTGETVIFDNGDLSIGAKDGATGSRVVVRGSSFAIQDYGRAVVEAVADRKHSANQFEADGSIWVRASDCP